MRCDGLQRATQVAGLDLGRLAFDLAQGAHLELYLTPKPGLVDLRDSGSHPDLTLGRMELSLRVVSGYLRELSAALYRGENLPALVGLGRSAEETMLRLAGTNCHRGYIFLSGLLLCASAGLPALDEAALREAVAGFAARLFGPEECRPSNGSRVRARFGVGGIREEALAGLPSLFDQALPVFRATLEAGHNVQQAVFAMLGRLMQTVEDTTSLHRCGREGLWTLRRDGRELERLVAEREDFIPYLTKRNAHYVERNLTMGGVADLLALALGWLSHTGELFPASGTLQPCRPVTPRTPEIRP